MTGDNSDKNFVYAVARIRCAELKLLDKAAMDSLIACQTPESVFSGLREKGWGNENDRTADEMLSSEREKLWALIEELIPDMSIFDIFKKPYDFHNLKAAIKESAQETDIPGIYISEGTIEPDVIRGAVKGRNFSMLPDGMSENAQEILDRYLRTGDGQLCDIMVDRLCLEEILRCAQSTEDEFLMQYAELKVAAADIKTAIRGARTGKSREFLEEAVADCPSLFKPSLIGAALSGEEQVLSYLATTDYADAVPAIRRGMTAFENYCDDLVTDRMKEQQTVSFGIGPVAAYLIARENEIKSVRIIFSGKENGFSDDMIRERVRETYV